MMVGRRLEEQYPRLCASRPRQPASQGSGRPRRALGELLPAPGEILELQWPDGFLVVPS